MMKNRDREALYKKLELEFENRKELAFSGLAHNDYNGKRRAIRRVVVGMGLNRDTVNMIWQKLSK